MVIRKGVGTFVVSGKGETASLLNKLKNLNVPVTSFLDGEKTIVTVNMGRLDPGEYRRRCEKVASVIQFGTGTVSNKTLGIVDWIAIILFIVFTVCIFWR
jgi:hypothetical protein